MNKISIILIAISILLAGCKKQPKENNPLEINEVEVSRPHAKISQKSNDWKQEIKLDGVDKWKANPETNIGVAKMQSVFTSNSPKELKDYQLIAEELNVHKNYVIQECTMKGASHDNLHIWLLPLIEEIEALKKANTVSDAHEIYKKIELSVNAYSIYFE
ncbi:MAG: hypothetical protein DWP94_08560 [Flavobacterium sp.]|nr:MAG: hypothetical protein DWP94_08560 [Flavobacterium sp.]